LSGEFRKPRGAGERGNRTNTRPRVRCHAPLEAGHPLSAHNGFVHNEALAYEIAACFYAARGFDKIAHTYLREARYCYLRWGATAKVRQLDDLYPGLTEEQRAISPNITIGTPIEHLDLGTVIKISQAVSGEMDLDKLIAH
jgi:hypothetical protein